MSVYNDSMSGDHSFQLLAIAILSLFTAIFCSTYCYNRRQVFAGWTGLAYFIVLISYSIDSIRGTLSSLTLIALSTALYWVFSLCIVQAIAARAGERFPVKTASAISTLGAIFFVAASQNADDISYRSIVVNVIAALLMLLSLPILRRSRESHANHVLIGLMIVIPMTMVARVIWVYGILGEHLTTSGYASSNYTWLFHFTSALSALALGMGFMLTIGNDMVARYRSETRLDPLTGLLNLRGLRAKYETHLDAGPICPVYHFLIQFDLDNFKLVNDCCGHVAGDAVLRRVAKALDIVMRDWGDVGRSGGEEFTVLLIVSDPKTVRLATEHLRLSLAMIAHSECPAHNNVTASFGVSRVQGTMGFDHARELADKALYRAKHGGRNRIEYANNFTGLSVAA